MRSFLLGALFLFFVPPAFSKNMTATVYDRATKSQKLFDWKRVESQTGNQTRIVGTFTSPEGEAVVNEEATLVDGKLSKYSVEQLQVSEVGNLEIKDNTIFFQYLKNGKITRSEEKLPENLVVIPTILDYLDQRWDALSEGKNVQVRLAVLDRRETVGFEYFKSADKKPQSDTDWVIKMKPSSFFLSALVDPLYFWMEKETKNLMAVEGRTLPKQKIDGHWTDLDAYIAYQSAE